MKISLQAMIASLMVAAAPAFAAHSPDDVAKSVINAYLLYQELPGAFPGGDTKPLDPKFLCFLTGGANTGFLLLDGRSDADIAQLLELVREKEVASLRERVAQDAKSCNK